MGAPLSGSGSHPTGQVRILGLGASRIDPSRFRRVLVCGGRDYSDRDFIFRILAKIMPDVIIEGDARGADRIAGYWARKNRIDNLKFPANWDAHGKAAGAIRNQQMLDEGRPDAVVAFPGGRGTADMVRRALYAGVTVLDYRGEAA